MNNRFLPRFLAATAVLSIMIYAINCRPAWSPDGKKVAWVYMGEDLAGIAVHDIASEKTISLLEVPSEDLIPIEVFWEKSGKGLFYVSAPAEDGEKELVMVSRYDFKSRRHELVSRIALSGASMASSLYPIFLQKGKYLWIYRDEEGYCRINIRSGEKMNLPGGKSRLYFDNGRRIYFLESSSDKVLTITRMKSGLFSGEKKLFSLPLEHKEENLVPICSIPRDENRFACIHEDEDREVLTIYDRKKKRILNFPAPDGFSFLLDDDNASGMTSSVWESSGKRLFLGCAKEEKDLFVAGFMEINVEKKSTNWIPVMKITGDDQLLLFQPSLSPGEDRLAVTMMTNEQFYLGLVDISGKEKGVALVESPATK